MEEEKKSKKIGWLVFLMILFIFTTIGLGTFVIYDKLIKKDDTTKTECNCPKTDENKCECEKCEEPEVASCNCPATTACPTSNKLTDQLLNTSIGTVYVLKNGSAYFEPSYKFKDSVTGDTTDIKQDVIDGLGSPSTYKITSSELFIEGYRNINGYKLNVGSVMYASEFYFGNGSGSTDIIFVTTDGKVYELSAYPDELASKFRVAFAQGNSKYKNIVAIIPASSDEGSGAIAYDKCNNGVWYFPLRYKD